MKKTTVVNRYHKLPFDVYIGRGSIWGNPFTHMEGTKAEFMVGTREDAVDAYREWIQKQPELLSRLYELKEKVLGCFCKPKACHGDVLAELANALPPRVLECSTQGNRNFSDTFARVTMWGVTDTIEQHYERAKRLNNNKEITHFHLHGKDYDMIRNIFHYGISCCGFAILTATLE